MRQEIKTFGKKDCRVVPVGNARLFFSYATLIAVDFGDGRQVRTDEFFSRTTGTHRALMGCANFLSIPEQDFAEMVDRLRLV